MTGTFYSELFASRAPLFEFEFENALFAFAYDKPPFAFALLFERPTQRHPMRPSTFFGVIFSLQEEHEDSSLTDDVSLSLSYCYFFISGWDAYATSFFTLIAPLKASRAPRYEFELENALFALAYDKPPNASAPLCERPTQRHREAV